LRVCPHSNIFFTCGIYSPILFAQMSLILSKNIIFSQISAY
jgi:hypothetical protein